LPLLVPLLLASTAATARAAVRNVELNITHGFQALDGVERLVILGAYIHTRTRSVG
jgi:hypothetical protein